MKMKMASITGLLLVAACSRPQIPVDVYTVLGPAQAMPAVGIMTNNCVLVPDAQAYGVFAEAAMVERRGPRLVRDLYRVWSPRPAQALALAMADTLAVRAAVPVLVHNSGNARWVLQTMVRDWSYEQTPSGLVARIEMDAYLTDTDRHVVVAQRRAACTTPADGVSYEALAVAFKASLDRVCEECAPDIATAIKASGQPAGK